MFVFFIHLKVSDRQGSNFESSHHPRDVLWTQFSLYVHKGGIKPHSFHFNFLKVITSNSIKKARIKHLPHRSYLYTTT